MELIRLLASVRRHRRAVLLIGLLTAGLGAVFAAAQQPSYEVTSRIVLGPNEAIVDANDRIQVGQVLNQPVMAANLSEIITSDRVLADARWAADVQPLDMEEIEVTALIAPDSNVLEVQVTGPEERLVVDLVEPITSESVVLFEEIYPVFRAEIIDSDPEPETLKPPGAMFGAAVGLVVGMVLAVFVALFIDAVKQPRPVVEPHRATGRPTDDSSEPGSDMAVVGDPEPVAAPGDEDGKPERTTRSRRSRPSPHHQQEIDLRSEGRRLPPFPGEHHAGRPRVEPAASRLDPAMFSDGADGPDGSTNPGFPDTTGRSHL